MTTKLASSNINNLQFSSQEQCDSFWRLPLSVRTWAYFEQAKNPKAYDPDFYPKPSETSLPPSYMPENRSIIQLEAWLVNNQILQGITTQNNPFLDKFYHSDGTYTVLVHPSMSNPALFQQLGARPSSDTYYFIPLASPRTGITWKAGEEHSPFISKMSIRPEQYQSMTISRVKADLGPEAKMSVIKTSCVQSYCKDKDSYLFDQFCLEFQQQYTPYTQGLGSYGVLYRSIPDYVLQSNTTLIPFFALASQDSKPLIVSMIEQSGTTIDQYIQQTIFEPVAKFILDNAKANIYPEHLHGQNLLIKAQVDPHSPDGIYQLIPEVAYRDIADLKIGPKAETQRYINFRQQQGGRESIFTPGSFAYEAATQFLICSAMPMINTIIQAQQQGYLPPTQYGYADRDKLCMQFMQILLNTMSMEVVYSNPQEKQHAYNGLYEFASMAHVTQRICKNTSRERQWQNATTTEAAIVYKKLQSYGELDQSRQEKLMQHIQEYTQEATMRYMSLDQSREASMQARSGSMPYSTSHFSYQRPSTMYLVAPNQNRDTQPCMNQFTNSMINTVTTYRFN